MTPFIFAVNAISGGGKTTMAVALQKQLTNSKALYFDDRNYDLDSGIEDIVRWVEDGADVNKFNLERLAEDIEKLKQEEYGFIILDYPFGYRHSLIGPYLNYSIFIDTPLDIAMARRIVRDYGHSTAISIIDEMKHYLHGGRNAYLYGQDTGKRNADFLVDGSLSIEEIVCYICEKVNEVKNSSFC